MLAPSRSFAVVTLANTPRFLRQILPFLYVRRRRRRSTYHRSFHPVASYCHLRVLRTPAPSCLYTTPVHCMTTSTGLSIHILTRPCSRSWHEQLLAAIYFHTVLRLG
ncbi:hypothetical protein BD311DRAFT_88576 [Dichomitus squalens]|uniref:Uncharacterized protein n=1 Tax=Dichomitus squalens TaxID=114155 RepID=A0A4V2JZ16_9APHY|nr:hypothetical protein BD311DRAFT_88576 [Dichomitus squalens]